LGWVLFWTEVASALELNVYVGWSYVHQLLLIYSVSADYSVAILAKEASSHIVLMRYSQVPSYRYIHLLMPKKLNTTLLLLSDLSKRCLDLI
jgi:hypothetical protein